MTWQLQDAKNKLSEVVDTSIVLGPQIISRRGKDTAVIMSYDDYRRLTAPQHSLKSILKSSGFDALTLSRDQSATGRTSSFDL